MQATVYVGQKETIMKDGTKIVVKKLAKPSGATRYHAVFFANVPGFGERKLGPAGYVKIDNKGLSLAPARLKNEETDKWYTNPEYPKELINGPARWEAEKAIATLLGGEFIIHNDVDEEPAAPQASTPDQGSSDKKQEGFA